MFKTLLSKLLGLAKKDVAFFKGAKFNFRQIDAPEDWTLPFVFVAQLR